MLKEYKGFNIFVTNKKINGLYSGHCFIGNVRYDFKKPTKINLIVEVKKRIDDMIEMFR